MFRCETCGATVPSQCRCRKDEPTTTQTTPGPWGVEFTSCGESDPRCRGGWRVTGPYHSSPHGYEREADARLMASSLDLLAQRDALLSALREFATEVYDPATRAMCGVSILARLARADEAIALAESRA